MDRQELVEYILHQIDASDSMSGEYVLIHRNEAVRIIRELSGEQDIGKLRKKEDGRPMYYCVDCARSFRAEGREDPECFRKWHYHTWYALCPSCGREVSRNDRYWR